MMTGNEVFSDVVGVVGLLIGIVGIWGGRRQRSKRHQSDLIIQDLVGQLRGFLIGIKPAVQHNEATTRAVNDNIALIKSAKKKLDEIN
jgi:uncharacterized membrane protein HdeD (DUF308 family)